MASLQIYVLHTLSSCSRQVESWILSHKFSEGRRESLVGVVIINLTWRARMFVYAVIFRKVSCGVLVVGNVCLAVSVEASYVLCTKIGVCLECMANRWELIPFFTEIAIRFVVYQNSPWALVLSEYNFTINHFGTLANRLI